MRIIAGKFYKYKETVYRAELCTFCNMRRVENYKTCLLSLKGRLDIPGNLIADCMLKYYALHVTESTESEYVAQHLERRL